MSFGAAGRDLRIPGTAIALGQRTDAGSHEAPADNPAIESAVARQSRSVFPPDTQHWLPADDRGERADAAGDDRALLHGLAGNAIDRSAADRGVVLVNLSVLCGRPARAFPE